MNEWTLSFWKHWFSVAEATTTTEISITLLLSYIASMLNMHMQFNSFEERKKTPRVPHIELQWNQIRMVSSFHSCFARCEHAQQNN